MPIRPESEKAYYAFMFVGAMLLMMHLYYYAYPLWESLGLSHPVVVKMFLKFRGGGFFDSPYYTKCFALLMSVMTVIVRHGRGKEAKWWQISAVTVSGLLMYFLPFGSSAVYVAASLAGYVAIVFGVAMAVQKAGGFRGRKNDMRETFEQCEERIDTPDSVNIPIRYRYRGRDRRGWLNFVNCYRAVLILGTPGSGKSYSVYLPFMEQMISKGYTMFVYGAPVKAIS